MGKGIMTNTELIDSIIVDLNNVLKEQINGQFIQACGLVSQIGRKLINLRTAVDNDIKSREQMIEDLKREIRAAGREVIDLTPEQLQTEKEGANNGGN